MHIHPQETSPELNGPYVGSFAKDKQVVFDPLEKWNGDATVSLRAAETGETTGFCLISVRYKGGLRGWKCNNYIYTPIWAGFVVEP